MLLRDLKPLIPELKATRLKLKTGDEKPSEKAAPVSAPAASAASADSASSAVSAVSAASESGEVMIPLSKAEQVQALFGEVVRNALTDNNEVLKKDISSTVTTDVMHEIDFLLQAKERQQEEHFRRLDSLIRQQQANRREIAKTGPLMKLRKIFT